MTADGPKPAWWPPHVAGVLLCHGAWWLGLWQLWGNQPLRDAVIAATVEPLEFLPHAFVFAMLAVAVPAGVIWAALPYAPESWRRVRVVGTYAVLAATWVLAARMAYGWKHLLDGLD